MADLVLSGLLNLKGTLKLAGSSGGKVKVDTFEVLVEVTKGQAGAAQGVGAPVILPPPPASPVDTGTDAGLRHVVEEAGLAWDDARPHLDGEGWREEVEENRRVLMKSGLWGVPSFRLLGEGDEPDFSTWGQDRLWLVEEILRRRVAPTDPSGDTRSTI